MAVHPAQSHHAHGRSNGERASLWNLEQRIHLPSEVALQKAFIDNRPTMVFMNLYYGGVHVPAAAALLLWLLLPSP